MSRPRGRDASPRTVPPAAPAGYPPGLTLPVDDRPYPPIGDYALLGDCHAVALVSRLGSIDWCCLPRIDSASCFGRLLDWERGGYCAITPREPVAVRRDNLDDSLVLETRLRGARGEARLLDFFAMREDGRRAPRRQLVGPWRRRLLRSAAVIKGLVHAPSGAIAAAATTSLPESPGAARNWDYRYTWIRDSTLALRSLAELGFHTETAAFCRFVERTAADDVDGLQVLYGVRGAHRVPTLVLAGHHGYRGARPVRVGNAAAVQPQLDMYGDPRREMLGNFPQGLTHYSYITAAVALARARPPPRLSPPARVL